MRILLIEDDKTIADFIGQGMKQAGYQITHVDNGRDGLHLALCEAFDAGIIDIMLPQMDGVSIVEKMRERKINLPVIFLSAKRSIDDRVHGLHRGGDDYLTKPFSFSELLARVQALIRRANQVVESTTLSSNGLSLDLLARTVSREGKKIDLQPKEFALLEYLLRNEGHIVSKTMIMERVWDYNFDPHTNVVEARISKLREKVDHGFASPLIHTVRGVGYVLKLIEVEKV